MDGSNRTLNVQEAAFHDAERVNLLDVIRPAVESFKHQSATHTLQTRIDEFSTPFRIVDTREPTIECSRNNFVLHALNTFGDQSAVSFTLVSARLPTLKRQRERLEPDFRQA